MCRSVAYGCRAVNISKAKLEGPVAELLAVLQPTPGYKPEEPIDRTEARPFWSGSLHHRDLMPEGEDFCRELEMRPNRGPESGKQGDQQRGHAAAHAISLCRQLQRPQRVPNLQ
jgi:hypothetical protein